MDGALVIAVAAAVVSLVALLLSWVLATRSRRRLAVAENEVAALRERLEELSRQLGDGAPEADTALPSAEYVITSLSDPAVEPVAARPQPEPDRPSGRDFATVALGESLVRVLALGHGVRRAMSAENRNRIRFEMHREVKRARRQRRRDVREARRYLRNGGRTGTTADLTPDMSAEMTGDAA